MTRFRPTHGTLDDSMRRSREVASLAELIRHLQPLFTFSPPIDWSQIVVEPYFMQPDPRTGWDETWIVHLPGSAVFGFTDGPLI